MGGPSDSPFDDADNSHSNEDSEFSLRPLRILKRPEASLSSQSSKRSSSDEFVCRPMRLNSASTSGRDRAAESHALPLPANEPEASSAEKNPPSKTVSHGRTPSIQIKNLPIVNSPKKRNSAVDMSQSNDTVFALCLVDFHHVRGPEVQWWKSHYHEKYDPDAKLFKNLAFQALPDGAHLFEETFSNFNLVYDFVHRLSLDDSRDIENFKGNPNHLETLFGCSCVRQVKKSDLSDSELERNKDITRSIVQKAVVIISRKQPIFTKIKEKLSIITHSYFQQGDFSNFELLESLFENLNDSFKIKDDTPASPRANSAAEDAEQKLQAAKYEQQEEFFVNLNLREILLQFKSDMLVILKALLLERKVLVYSNNNLELLTQFQNNLIALIPNLINNLSLSGCPLCDYTEKYSPLQKPTSLKTNDRMSMLRFFGLPLQVFNTKGSFWNPYLPLPQMDELEAQSFMVGCSNLLIVNRSTHYKIDLVVDLDSWTVSFPMGKTEDLRLTSMDKKFVSTLLATNRAKEDYVGSDDYIRYQFEDYIRSLLSITRFHQYTERFQLSPPGFDTQADRRIGNIKAFNEDFLQSWFTTKNFQIWNATCDEFIFNFHSPSHIAVDISEPEAHYNIGGLFSSLKRTPHPAINLADRANQYFQNVQKPRKFFADTEKEDTNKQRESADRDEQKSAWNLGFKKGT